MVDYTIKKLPHFRIHRGHKTVSINFKKGKYTREQIREVVEDYNKTAHEKGFNGYLMVSLKYPDKYRAGKATKIGEPIDLFHFKVYPDSDPRKEPKYFEKFFVYVSTPEK